MIRKVMEAFTEAQESIVNELNYILNELVVGKTEEAYTSLRDLRDELVTDIRISREEQSNMVLLNSKKEELSHDDQINR